MITDTYSATWDSKGAITTDWQTPGTASQCAGIKRTVSGNFYSLDGSITSLNVTYGVYVSPTAAAGPLPTTYMVLHKTSGSNREYALNFSNLVVTKTQCTMNTAAVVPFGDVTPGQGTDGKGIAVQSSLNVNCTNDAGTSTDITYSVTPKTQAGDDYTLPMISTAGGSVAGDIRGFMGPGLTIWCGCCVRARRQNPDRPRRRRLWISTGNTPSLRITKKADCITAGRLFRYRVKPQRKEKGAQISAGEGRA